MKYYDVYVTIDLTYSVRAKDKSDAEEVAVEEMYDNLKSANLGNFTMNASTGDWTEDAEDDDDDDDDDDEQVEEEDQWNGPKQ